MLDSEALHAPTFGEQLLNRLLRDLPKKEFFFHYEPQLNTADGKSSKPDFIVVSATLGVVIVEVKDWVQITSGDQRVIHTIRTDGTPMTHANPIRTAEGYAYDLKRRFEERAELWEQYKGRRALKFPWQCLVALPRIGQSIIQQFERAAVWQRGTVIGKEQLASAAHLERVIRSLPWKFKLERPLSLDMLDILREIIDPSLAVVGGDGQPIGTLTRQQHALVTEPLPSLMPKQTALFDDDDFSTETLGIAENTQVRLVRGVAGSGKTLVMVRRVRHLAEQYPEARQLVLTFNVDLAADLQQRIDLPDSHVEIINFHKICRRILTPIWRDPVNLHGWLRRSETDAIAAMGLPLDFVADEITWRKEIGLLDDTAYLNADRSGRGRRLDQGKREQINTIFNRYRAYQQTQYQHNRPWFDWEDVAELTLEALQQHPLRGSYDAIFIDEGQDFAPAWMQVVKLLLKPDGLLFVCDDPSQSIFRAYSWQQKGLSVIGRSRVLRVPFRSTREISQAAHSLIEADETLRLAEERTEPDFTSYELGTGPLPALLACHDESAEVAFVRTKVEELIQSGLSGREIAILCHDKNDAPHWSSLQTQGVYVRHFEKMKGLEFTAVFVPHLQDAFDTTLESDAVAALRRKLFTAMTRARHRLFLSYHGRLPGPLTPLLEHVWCESIVSETK